MKTPTPEQQTAYDEMIEAWRTLTSAVAELIRVLEPPSQEELNSIPDQRADLKTIWLMGELGYAYVLRQVWNTRFKKQN